MIPAAIIQVDSSGAGRWHASVAIGSDWVHVETDADGHGVRLPEPDGKLSLRARRAMADLIERVAVVQETADLPADDDEDLELTNLDRVTAATVAIAIAEGYRHDWPTREAVLAAMTSPHDHDPQATNAFGLLRRVISRYPAIALQGRGLPCLMDEQLAWWQDAVAPAFAQLMETAAALQAAGRAPAATESDPTCSTVVAGPHGHWYAWVDGELAACPMDADEREDSPPLHPGSYTREQTLRDGWYDPEDLQGVDRALVLQSLGFDRNHPVVRVAQGLEPIRPARRGGQR